MITNYSSRFLLFDTGNKPNKMIAFASDIGLEILSKSTQGMSKNILPILHYTSV
jgi:hypothetical protein